MPFRPGSDLSSISALGKRRWSAAAGAGLAAGMALLLTALPAQADSLFTDGERAGLISFWNAPGRLAVALPPEAAQGGPWQVRLTPEASRWFQAYQKAT